MLITGWPEAPDADGCILPVTIVDVDFHGTVEELRAVSKFLLSAANELEIAQGSNLPLQASIELRNSNPDAKVGISINVVQHVED